ncbi:hypothetical protein UT300012_22520 [Paraclostridium bifermentans]
MSIKKIRGFEKVSEVEFSKHELDINYDALELPKRATKFAAGYDIKSTKSFNLFPGEEIVIPTGFKAYMQPGEMICLYPRSGMGFKYQIQLANTVGIGDGDYYNCESNEGHYMIKLVNRGTKLWEVKAGDGIGQAIFQPILLADGDEFGEGEERKGGFGSTDNRTKIVSRDAVVNRLHPTRELNLDLVTEVKSVKELVEGQRVVIVDSDMNEIMTSGEVGKLDYNDDSFIIAGATVINYCDIQQFSFRNTGIRVFVEKEDLDILQSKVRKVGYNLQLSEDKAKELADDTEVVLDLGPSINIKRELDFDGDFEIVTPSTNTPLINEYIDITLANPKEINEEEIKNLKKGDFVLGVENVGRYRYISGMVLEEPTDYDDGYSIDLVANDEHKGYRQNGINSSYGRVFKINKDCIKNKEFLRMIEDIMNR